MAIWPQVLIDLQSQLPPETFDLWLRDSTAALDDGRLTVRVASVQAAEWLEQRLGGMISRTVADLCRSNGTAAPAGIEFAAGGGRIAGDGRIVSLVQGAPEGRTGQVGRSSGMPVVPVAAAASPVDDADDFDTHSAGWMPVSHYENAFWAAFLGRVPWRVWELVRLADRRRKKEGWTPARRWTAPSLARSVPCSRHSITGTNRQCEADRPEAFQDPAGIWRFHQWGAFDWLGAAGVGKVVRVGTGRRTTYQLSVLVKLPVLRPEQAAKLAGLLQVRHDRWLADRGIDPRPWARARMGDMT